MAQARRMPPSLSSASSLLPLLSLSLEREQTPCYNIYCDTACIFIVMIIMALKTVTCKSILFSHCKERKQLRVRRLRLFSATTLMNPISLACARGYSALLPLFTIATKLVISQRNKYLPWSTIRPIPAYVIRMIEKWMVSLQTTQMYFSFKALKWASEEQSDTLAFLCADFQCPNCQNSLSIYVLTFCLLCDKLALYIILKKFMKIISRVVVTIYFIGRYDTDSA